MPYIIPELRAAFDGFLDDIDGKIWSEGELNYVVTRIVADFLGASPSYATYNAAIGVLECAKLELYRRMIAPYEDLKRVENGDVFQYTEDTKERNEPQ